MTANAAPINSVSEWCRTCLNDEVSTPADLIVWGKLFNKEALGPRCIRHFGEETGYSVYDFSVGQSAVFDLRPIRAALGKVTA
jgi:hypothetical protein